MRGRTSSGTAGFDQLAKLDSNDTNDSRMNEEGLWLHQCFGNCSLITIPQAT